MHWCLMLGVGCFVALDMLNSLNKYLPPLQTCSVVRKLSQPQCVKFSRDATAQIDGARQLGNSVARKVGVAAVLVGLLLSTGCPAGEN